MHSALLISAATFLYLNCICVIAMKHIRHACSFSTRSSVNLEKNSDVPLRVTSFSNCMGPFSQG